MLQVEPKSRKVRSAPATKASGPPKVFTFPGCHLKQSTTVLFRESPLWYLLAIAAYSWPVHYGNVAGAILSGFRVCFLGAFR